MAEQRMNCLAGVLEDLGGTVGDRVGMLLPDCYQGLEMIRAPMKARMAVVPMNVRLHPDEHAYALRIRGPSR